jgi:hypothetical protein
MSWNQRVSTQYTEARPARGNQPPEQKVCTLDRKQLFPKKQPTNRPTLRELFFVQPILERHAGSIRTELSIYFPVASTSKRPYPTHGVLSGLLQNITLFYRAHNVLFRRDFAKTI